MYNEIFAGMNFYNPGCLQFWFSFVEVRKLNDRVWHEKIKLIDLGFLHFKASS